LLGCRQGEEGFRFRREPGEGELMGEAELLLPLGGAKDAPAFDRDPEDAGHVGCGEDAFGFEEFGVALGPGGVGDDGLGFGVVGCLVEVDEGEHFAADGLVADPEDEVGSPLHGFDGVGKGEEKGADSFDIHAGSIATSWRVYRLRLVLPMV